MMTTIWTAPRTWNVGELVTAGLLNSHLRDNLEYLKAQDDLPLNYAAASSVSLYSTGGSGWADVDGANLRLNLTTSGGAVLLGLSAQAKHTQAGGEIRLAWSIDGARLGDGYGFCMLQAPAANYQQVISHTHARVLSAGAHVITLQFDTTAATCYLGGLAGGIFIWALELV
jgi:hypothetical protein